MKITFTSENCQILLFEKVLNGCRWSQSGSRRCSLSEHITEVFYSYRLSNVVLLALLLLLRAAGPWAVDSSVHLHLFLSSPPPVAPVSSVQPPELQRGLRGVSLLQQGKYWCHLEVTWQWSDLTVSSCSPSLWEWRCRRRVEESRFQQDEGQKEGGDCPQQSWTLTLVVGPGRGCGISSPTAVHPIISDSLELSHWLCLDLLQQLNLSSPSSSSFSDLFVNAWFKFF